MSFWRHQMNKKKILAWILFLSWLGVIFFFSSQNASSSSNLSNGILHTLEKMFNLPFRASFSSFVIRKLAHFTEYLILAILTCNLISKYTKLNKKNYCLIVLFCLFYYITLKKRMSINFIINIKKLFFASLFY